jgi:hypothetical protein
MPISDKQYARRLFLFMSVVAAVVGVGMLVLGVVSLATDLLGTQLTVFVFALGGLALGIAWHATWLRYRILRDNTTAR